MSQYNLSDEELIDLACKIYEEACGGYLDLKESISDKIVRDFLKNKITAEPATEASDRYAHAANAYRGPENNPSSWYTGINSTATSSATTASWTNIYGTTSSSRWFTPSNVYTIDNPRGITVSATGHEIVLRDQENVSPRPEELIRPDENIRIDE